MNWYPRFKVSPDLTSQGVEYLKLNVYFTIIMIMYKIVDLIRDLNVAI